jgi:hypothetical protein
VKFGEELEELNKGSISHPFIPYFAASFVVVLPRLKIGVHLGFPKSFFLKDQTYKKTIV